MTRALRISLWCALAIGGLARVAGAQTSATAILDRVEMNARRPIDFHAIVLPETVYVGQQATYQVAVMLSADARSRLRRNPEFLPPELHGLLAYELGTPTRVPARNYAGGVFEAHVFQRALFPVTSGAQVVPAPQLTYALPQSSSYFSREERFVVRAESAAFIVKALPAEGRPDDFNGAVGVFKSSVRIDTTVARVGDPLVLTLRVQGTGNVKLLPRPTIELDWASVVPGTERIQVDSSGALVRGTKDFDWILTPARDGRVIVPALRYAYFDPYAARYAMAESAPVALSIRSGTLASSDEGESVTLMPLRTVEDVTRSIRTWSGAGRPPADWLFWLVCALLLPLPFLLVTRSTRVASPRVRAGGVPTSSNASMHVEELGARGAARVTRRTLLASLATRFEQSPQALVSRRHVRRVLRRAGVTRQTTRELLVLLEQLDEVGFAPSASSQRSAEISGAATETDAARRATELLRRVESEAVPRGRQLNMTSMGALWMLAGLTSAAFLVAPLRAQTRTSPSNRVALPSLETPRDPVAAVGLARDAYHRRAFTEAAQRFQALVARQPRNPDLLANWGTAAWAAGDTVDAVIAWQRAARLEPLAVDLQEHISALPAGARGGVADIPMVPVSWLARVAVVLWFAGWLVLTWLAWQRRRSGDVVATRMSRWLRGMAQSMCLLALVALGAAWWGARALDASALEVVLRPETMRIAPGNDADAMGGVTTGDVVRVMESRDEWRRVVHADGRRGWLPAMRLLAIEESTNVTVLEAAPDRVPSGRPVSVP
ncbi:MAG: BatD family protein [Gemmatimonadaceae bacterium]|nr:BatD family protein [Gemmatimonadaceae bacterium]